MFCTGPRYQVSVYKTIGADQIELKCRLICTSSMKRFSHDLAHNAGWFDLCHDKLQDGRMDLANFKSIQLAVFLIGLFVIFHAS